MVVVKRLRREPPALGWSLPSAGYFFLVGFFLPPFLLPHGMGITSFSLLVVVVSRTFMVHIFTLLYIVLKK